MYGIFWDGINKTVKRILFFLLDIFPGHIKQEIRGLES